MSALVSSHLNPYGPQERWITLNITEIFVEGTQQVIFKYDLKWVEFFFCPTLQRCLCYG